MKNIRKRGDIRLVTSESSANYFTKKLNYKGHTIFSEYLGAVHLSKNKIKFNKPVYLGMCILDLSKTLMYEFHYNYMIPKFGQDNLKLLFTDTDSLFL